MGGRTLTPAPLLPRGQHRHELVDAAFQQELGTIYKDTPLGHPPVPPAQLALATILQAYTGVSDDEVIEATVTERRWQGSRARYRGSRKHLFDLRRCAVVHNLHVLQRIPIAQSA